MAEKVRRGLRFYEWRKTLTTRITLIEDSKETLQELAKKMSGFFAIQAITTEPFFGDEIEAEIKEFNPDLIILDLLLSETPESGLRVLRRIKESSIASVPVVVCSKFIKNDEPENKWRSRAIESGAVDAFGKNPFPESGVLLKYMSKSRAVPPVESK